MASSAIPFIFPAVHLNREWFGDGSMRQVAPVSPAIHLGADRILVIGAGRMADENERPAGRAYPSLAQIAGHALSSIFLDSMSVDLERMNRINPPCR
jgi:NTE family protein